MENLQLFLIPDLEKRSNIYCVYKKKATKNLMSSRMTSKRISHISKNEITYTVYIKKGAKNDEFSHDVKTHEKRTNAYTA